MRRVAVWLEGPQEFDELAFMFFLLSTNTVQTSLLFCFPNSPDNLRYQDARTALKNGEDICENHYDVHIFITAEQIGSNLFWKTHKNLAQITSSTWNRSFSPPSLFEYLVHSVICASTFILAGDMDTHDKDTTGCQFDYTQTKSHDRIDIALGFICADHRQQISKQIGASYLADIELLASFRWLGNIEESGSIASRLRAYFGQDLRRDSGYRKRFLERIQSNVDTLWFDFIKEIFKGVILIITTYALIVFGMKDSKSPPTNAETAKPAAASRSGPSGTPDTSSLPAGRSHPPTRPGA